jgi:hypothetical protein
MQDVSPTRTEILLSLENERVVTVRGNFSESVTMKGTLSESKVRASSHSPLKEGWLVFSSKIKPHFQAQCSLERIRRYVMVSKSARYNERLRWWRPAQIYWTGVDWASQLYCWVEIKGLDTIFSCTLHGPLRDVWIHKNCKTLIVYVTLDGKYCALDTWA